MAFKSLGTPVAGQATTTASAMAALPTDNSNSVAMIYNRSKLRVAVNGSGGLRLRRTATNDASVATSADELFVSGVEYIERGDSAFFSVMATSGSVDYSITAGELQE